jgi:hypothetical protein
VLSVDEKVQIDIVVPKRQRNIAKPMLRLKSGEISSRGKVISAMEQADFFTKFLDTQ